MAERLKSLLSAIQELKFACDLAGVDCKRIEIEGPKAADVMCELVVAMRVMPPIDYHSVKYMGVDIRNAAA